MATKRNNGGQQQKRGFQMNDKQKAKYAELFTSALDQMEDAQWTKPWVAPRHMSPANYARKNRPYRGINDFLLTLLCAIKGWETPLFLTFEQLTDMGLSLNMMEDEDGNVILKDNGMPLFEGSFPVVKMLPNIYYEHKRITMKEYDELDEEEKEKCRKFFSMRAWPEFNLSQTDFKAKFPEKWEELTRLPEHDYQAGTRDEVLERMIMQGEWRCAIKFGGHSSHYSPSEDIIRLPERSHFLGDQLFYSTAIHEMAHSTAGELKRDMGGEGFGSEGYAREEFVAELTAACVCSMLGIGRLLDEQHIAYVNSWRKAIRDDKDFYPQKVRRGEQGDAPALPAYADGGVRSGELTLPLWVGSLRSKLSEN